MLCGHLRPGLVLLGISLAFASYLVPPPSLVEAVPPLISNPHHPFDPDWLEVSALIQRKCLGCHVADPERVDLSSYKKILAAAPDDEPILVPGDADSSLIFDYLTWNVDADSDSPYADQPKMPPDRHEWLTARQLETFRRWIENGALQYVLPDQCNIRPLLESDFPSAKQCAACHPTQYEQWSRSMHAYAQHSPVFEAFNLTLAERTSGTLGTFCSRCHTPIGTTLGEKGWTRNVNRSRISMEGITCIVCHRQARPQYKNSGRIEVQPGDMFTSCIYGPFDDAVSLQTGAHESTATPHIKTSQFCGNCHDVVNPQGIRLEEAFSEWLNSPAAKAGIRCHDCHMGPIQGVPIAEHERPLGRAAVVPGVDPKRIPMRPLSDHSFAGPDYSLLPDTEFPYKLDWMYETDYRDVSGLTPYQQRTLTELRRKNRAALRIAAEKRYELLRNGARLEVTHPHAVRVGSKAKLRTTVQSVFSGHSYPTGFTAERQLWVYVEVRDPHGNVTFQSGGFDHNGDLLDAHSHDVLTGKLRRDKYLLNFQNKFIALSHKGTDLTVIVSVNRNLQPVNVLRPATGIFQSAGRPPGFRIARASLPPLKAVGKTYPVQPTCVGCHHVLVQLRFRHLPPTLLDHIGTPHLKHLLETVVLEEYTGVIQVVAE